MSTRQREKAQRRREAKRNSPPTARLRYLRMSATKVRAVANLVKGKPVEEALAILEFTPRKAARHLRKLIDSAVANADQRGKDVDKLVVKSIAVDDAGHLRRWRPRAMGRAYPIRKHRSHVTVVLDEGAN